MSKVGRHIADAMLCGSSRGNGAGDSQLAIGGSAGYDALLATGGRLATGGAAGSGGVAGRGGLRGTGGAGTGGSGTGGGAVDARGPGASLWELVTAPMRAWSAVALGNGTLVVVGDVTDASNQQNLITSTDGVNWTARSTGAPGDTWTPLAYENGTLVAIGYPTTSDDAVILRSPDDASWTSVPGGWTAAYDKIAFGNEVFVLTGTQISSGGGPAYQFRWVQLREDPRRPPN